MKHQSALLGGLLVGLLVVVTNTLAFAGGSPLATRTTQALEQRDTTEAPVRFEGLVDIGGRALYATVRGNGPTIVLEKGADGGGAFGSIVDEIAGFATLVTYDRAGVDRSDPPPFDASAAEISQDLHSLLNALSLPRPAVLVGWSLTGLSVLYHACRHPQDVAGLVLIDPSPYTLFDDPESRAWLQNSRAIRPQGREELAEWLRDRSGPILDQELLLDYADSLIELRTARSGELRRFEDSCAMVKRIVESGCLPDVPITVLSAELRTGTLAFMQRIAHQNHKRIAQLARQGRYVLVKGGSHQMTLDRPDAIVEAIRGIVQQSAGRAR